MKKVVSQVLLPKVCLFRDKNGKFSEWHIIKIRPFFRMKFYGTTILKQNESKWWNVVGKTTINKFDKNTQQIRHTNEWVCGFVGCKRPKATTTASRAVLLMMIEMMTPTTTMIIKRCSKYVGQYFNSVLRSRSVFVSIENRETFGALALLD